MFIDFQSIFPSTAPKKETTYTNINQQANSKHQTKHKIHQKKTNKQNTHTHTHTKKTQTHTPLATSPHSFLFPGCARWRLVLGSRPPQDIRSSWSPGNGKRCRSCTPLVGGAAGFRLVCLGCFEVFEVFDFFFSV